MYMYRIHGHFRWIKSGGNFSTYTVLCICGVRSRKISRHSEGVVWVEFVTTLIIFVEQFFKNSTKINGPKKTHLLFVYSQFSRIFGYHVHQKKFDY